MSIQFGLKTRCDMLLCSTAQKVKSLVKKTSRCVDPQSSVVYSSWTCNKLL
jgi:hypothetical protein